MSGWNEEISALPGAHFLQTWEWGQFKAIYGWKPIHRVWRNPEGKVNAAALILARTVKLGGIGPRFKVLYVPRGPLLRWDDPLQRAVVLEDLQELARKENAIFIKIDPEVIIGVGNTNADNDEPGRMAWEITAELNQRGWHTSQEQIQFKNTICLDLEGGEDRWLARMKQKTRYNIRLAEKKGVVVRRGNLSDLPEMYRMYAETSVRDGFVIRSEGYYRHVWEAFLKTGMAEALIAEVDGTPVAGLILFMFAGRAWYVYGMSRMAHREKMPNYLLQWEAMKTARNHGCLTYDLWGAPDIFDETDPMWGVFRFKQGLGGEAVRFIGAWDYPVRPVYYQLYTNILPRILNIMRHRGSARVRREVTL